MDIGGLSGRAFCADAVPDAAMARPASRQQAVGMCFMGNPPRGTTADRAGARRGWSGGRRCCRKTTGEWRSEEHTSELQSLMRNSYAVFCLKKKKTRTTH